MTRVPSRTSAHALERREGGALAAHASGPLLPGASAQLTSEAPAAARHIDGWACSSGATYRSPSRSRGGETLIIGRGLRRDFRAEIITRTETEDGRIAYQP